MLNEAIDRIWGWKAPPESAEAVASSLRSRELHEAAIIHLSILLEAEPSEILAEEIIIGGLAVKLIATDDPSALIRYNDVHIGFKIEGASVVRQDGPNSLSSLLYLYQYARDRGDTLLYLPQQMRNERIATLMEETGASERFVRYALAYYHSLSAKIAA